MDGSFVLSVEDNDGDFFLLEMALKECQRAIELRRASDGESAISFLLSVAVEKSRPALVLLDVNMPKANGFDVLQFMKAHEAISDIPVVMFTSAASSREKQRALTMGAQGYVTKPLGLDRMMEVVNEICSKHLPQAS